MTRDSLTDVATYTVHSSFASDDVAPENNLCLDLSYTMEEQSWTDGVIVLSAHHRCPGKQNETIALPISDTLKPFLHQASTVPSDASSKLFLLCEQV